jgi:class 3 adenylate cyclase
MLTRYLGGLGSSTALGAAVLSMLLASVFGGLVRGRRARRQLAPFFPPVVRRALARRRDTADLAPCRRVVSVLACDLRGLTLMAEVLEPRAVGEMLRDALSEMTRVVFEHGGTLPVCGGDTLLALYNAPLDDPAHARSALRTALELQERMMQLVARWPTRLGVGMRPGIGIATGEAVVGTMGPVDRQTYTAVGATVELASALQSLVREHGRPIVIDEATRQRLDGAFLTRRLAEARGAGSASPVLVHAVLADDIRKQPRALLEVAATAMLLGAGETCLVTTRDVSEGGMALGGVPTAWGPGTRVEIRCEGGRLAAPLLTQGVVVWRRDEEAGVSFAALDPEARPTVAQYVARQGDRRVAALDPLC